MDFFSNPDDVLIDVLNSCGLGLWKIGAADGNTLKVDHNAGIILGLDEAVSSLTLAEFLDYCDEDDRGGIRQVFSVLIREPGSSRGVEFRIKSRKDGIYRWGRAVGKSYTEDGRITVMGIVQLLEGGKAFDFLFECINTDPLTGIYNRRHFTELALGYLERMRRFDSPCCAMILDLDFFKRVNDTWGHQAGDEVLKKAASIMKCTLRSYDLLARYGGEEFIVLAPDTNKNAAFVLADRIREEIEKNPSFHNGAEIFITVSIGVAEAFPGCTLEELIEGADKGLYEAKEKGRNRVIEYDFR